MRRGRTGFSWWCCVIVVWCACMGTRPVGAQVGSGDITGVLTDQSGAAVPGATVTVTNVATNRQRVVSSTSDGAYTAASLPRASTASRFRCPASRRSGAMASRSSRDRRRAWTSRSLSGPSAKSCR